MNHENLNVEPVLTDLKLGAVLTDENLFLVISMDGKKQFMLAQTEDELPVNIPDVAFAASLAEMETLLAEMRGVMALRADEGKNGVLLSSDENGGSK